MGNSLRCCLACVLPCGALDLIRIVHLNGHVEEITGPVTAAEILKANPNHVLSKPSSQGVVRKIMILSPDSELKRGSIYFLIPSSSVPEKRKPGANHRNFKKPSRKINREDLNKSKSYLEEDITSGKRKDHHQRRHHHHQRRHSGRVGEWQPRLESITED
ncbi:uncharacterized protein LOC110823781 [Carica papaya]|uniref:uncharacterized protein LOC110823781 n=1 Tax=Carica papaya TaxID=3649 RepID=UPI000B8C6EA9|nr:uncharacterized protein LOC110823781 [Carica papaya]